MSLTRQEAKSIIRSAKRIAAAWKKGESPLNVDVWTVGELLRGLADVAEWERQRYLKLRTFMASMLADELMTEPEISLMADRFVAHVEGHRGYWGGNWHRYTNDKEVDAKERDLLQSLRTIERSKDG